MRTRSQHYDQSKSAPSTASGAARIEQGQVRQPRRWHGCRHLSSPSSGKLLPHVTGVCYFTAGPNEMANVYVESYSQAQTALEAALMRFKFPNSSMSPMIWSARPFPNQPYNRNLASEILTTMLPLYVLLAFLVEVRQTTPLRYDRVLQLLE